MNRIYFFRIEREMVDQVAIFRTLTSTSGLFFSRIEIDERKTGSGSAHLSLSCLDTPTRRRYTDRLNC